ncbi:midnolin isoform X2 [Ischnura elegans]|uniref:midnolin isoform X2 n=1 Tax=Ischnura elegans TaxID=197161 RepID=UPI001ED88709|nr:midnolin isoform X2 [Ischnura elegans]
MEGGGNSGTPQSGECSKGSSNNVVGSESDLSGCGCGSGVTNSDSSITVRVTPTTGGQFDLQVAKMETVENLKKIISKKLKVPKERICLLHRDRQLRDGTLHENQLMDGSRLTLLPSVETGLLAQRPEQSVMQALESLNDSQVNDFLSGKAPLNLTMRLGDHMMLIQLQLSTVTPSTASSSSSSSSATLASSSRRSSSSAASSSSSTSSSRLISSSSYSSSSHHHSRSGSSTRTTPHPPPHPPPNLNFTRPTSSPSSSTNSSSSTPASSHLHHPVSPTPSAATTVSAAPLLGGTCAGRGLTSAHHPSASSNVTSSTAVASSTTTATSSSATPSCRCDASPSAPTHSVTCPLSSSPSSSAATAAATPPAGTPATAAAAASTASAAAAPKPTLDTRALAEASRNLTQTLKQLSSEESTSSANRRRQGAIIESMHHHGKGVYSGTFSGTLNPALQDKFGRPKRDISTIIHILNDLLCATPQYRRHARQGHTITIETPGPSPSAQSHSSGNTTSSASGSSSRPEMMDDEEESVELSRENQATRGKMEQLRLIMEERRARRRARREARAAPYSHGSAALSGSSTSSSQWGGTVAGANYAQSAEVGENSAAINSNVPSAMDADSSTIPVSAGTATIPVSNCSSISMGNSASVNVPGMVPLPEPPTAGAVAELQVAGRDSTPPGTGVSGSGNGGGAVSDGGSTTNASGGANGSGTNSASGSGDSPMETDSSAEICELNAEPVVA